MNRNKLIEIFISNLANSIIHKILEKAIEQAEIAEKYDKEVRNSWQIAKIYREKINPSNRSLPFRDISEIKSKIKSKIENELKLRIEKGYKNINLELIEKFIERALKDMLVIEKA
ncbi:hypothetical protein FJZ19_02255 [Candidatus Pacearchaeota archaeon]|nr:hypothetical protein [Candidatus Pacearchaeota archaeon]